MASNITINAMTIQNGFNFTTSSQANHIKFGILIVLHSLPIPCFQITSAESLKSFYVAEETVALKRKSYI
jgi:hypothetical protein